MEWAIASKVLRNQDKQKKNQVEKQFRFHPGHMSSGAKDWHKQKEKTKRRAVHIASHVRSMGEWGTPLEKPEELVLSHGFVRMGNATVKGTRGGVER